MVGLKVVTLPLVTVSSAGTAVPLHSTSLLVYYAYVQASLSNTGTQYIGDSSGDSTNMSEVKAGDGIEIFPDKNVGMDQVDLSQFYVDSSVNGATFRVQAYVRGEVDEL